MGEDTIIFEKNKVACMMEIGRDVLTNIKFNKYEHHNDCFVRDKLVIRMEADLFKKTVAEKDITFIMDRPSFFDWLFRRRKVKSIRINISDVLNNPPMTDGNVNVTRFYDYKKLYSKDNG